MTAKNRDSDKHKLRSILKKFENKKPATLSRPAPNRIPREKILIYCEGRNTEPSYFKQFRLSNVTIHTFGEGRNTLTLVERAVELKSKSNYKQVWCVFDADEHGVDNFNRAIALAQKHKMRVAYSIQAFEYWLILHFEDHQGGRLHRSEYNKKINSYTNPHGIEYDGNGCKRITDDLFELLMATESNCEDSRVSLAIKRARRVYNSFNHRSPGTEESSTTVFQLVEEIMDYL